MQIWVMQTYSLFVNESWVSKFVLSCCYINSTAKTPDVPKLSKDCNIQGHGNDRPPMALSQQHSTVYLSYSDFSTQIGKSPNISSIHIHVNSLWFNLIEFTFLFNPILTQKQIHFSFNVAYLWDYFFVFHHKEIITVFGGTTGIIMEQLVQ